MNIHGIKVTEEKDYIKVSAKCKIRRFAQDELYFKVNKKYKDFIFTDASPFAVALLIPSMKLGEDLVIDGSIPEKLYKGMKESIKFMTQWSLGLKRINIKVKTLTKDKQNANDAGSLFSGGVDSFYTYLKHKTGKNRISYFILVNGYDIDLSNTKLWDLTLKRVKQVASKGKISVITVESNLYSLINPIANWNYSYIGGLSAIALLLRNRLKVVYRASSYKRSQIHDFLDVVVDHYFNTEKLSIVFDGADATRLEKVKYIAKSKIVLEHLRVCYLNENNPYNCGICDKCLRTMIGLRIAGKLSETKTFPHKIDTERVKKLSIEGEYAAMFQRENLDALKKMHIEPKLIEALEYCLGNFSTKNGSGLNIVEKVIYLDHMYNKAKFRKLYAFIKNQIST